MPKDKKYYFGKIENSQPVLNKVGRVLEQVWFDLPKIFSGIELDYHVVMPNHFHGIIIFNQKPGYSKAKKDAGLSQIIGALKAKTNFLVKRELFPKIQKFELWQKTFYDRVIRDDKELLNIRGYIENNPLKWELDEYYG